MKFAPMAIPAMALLQQHDARRDILIEPAACSDRSSGAFGTGRNRAVKTNRLVGLSVALSVTLVNPEKKRMKRSSCHLRSGLGWAQ